MPRIRIIVALLLAGTVQAALAGTPINQSRPLDPRGKVEISNVKGSIQVSAWDRNEVQISGTLGEGAERLLIDGDRSDLEIKVQYPRNSAGRSEGTVLQVKVPLQASLEIGAVSASVDVTGVASALLEVDSVSGDISVAAAPASASFESVSGNQRLTVNSAGNVSVNSVSGDIRLSGRLKGSVEAETVSGRIDIDSKGQALRSVALNSVSGDIGVRAGLAGDGEIKGETVSGNLTLQLPKNLSARVNAESFSGDLSATGAEVKKEKYGPGSSLETRYGDGRGRIRVQTFSGDLHLTVD